MREVVPTGAKADGLTPIEGACATVAGSGSTGGGLT